MVTVEVFVVMLTLFEAMAMAIGYAFMRSWGWAWRSLPGDMCATLPFCACAAAGSTAIMLYT